MEIPEHVHRENGLPAASPLLRKSSVESQTNTVESDPSSPGVMLSPQSMNFYQSPNSQMPQMFNGLGSNFTPKLMSSFKNDKNLMGPYSPFFPVPPCGGSSPFSPPNPAALTMASSSPLSQESMTSMATANGFHNQLMSQALSMTMMPPGMNPASYGIGNYAPDIQGLFISAAAQAISAALKPLPMSTGGPCSPHITPTLKSRCDNRWNPSPGTDIISSKNYSPNKHSMEQPNNVSLPSDLSTESSRVRRHVTQSTNHHVSFPPRTSLGSSRKRRSTSDCNGPGKSFAVGHELCFRQKLFVFLWQVSAGFTVWIVPARYSSRGNHVDAL